MPSFTRTDGSVPITKDDLQQRVAGKAFTVRLADGTHWDIAFTSAGGLSVETSKGFKGSGDWKADEGKLCSQMRAQDLRCGEARLFENFLYVKRADGEVIKYVPK